MVLDINKLNPFVNQEEPDILGQQKPSVPDISGAQAHAERVLAEQDPITQAAAKEASDADKADLAAALGNPDKTKEILAATSNSATVGDIAVSTANNTSVEPEARTVLSERDGGTANQPASNEPAIIAEDEKFITRANGSVECKATRTVHPTMEAAEKDQKQHEESQKEFAKNAMGIFASTLGPMLEAAGLTSLFKLVMDARTDSGKPLSEALTHSSSYLRESDGAVPSFNLSYLMPSNNERVAGERVLSA